VGQLLNHFRPVSTLAFCNTKQQCRDLVAVLQAQGFSALALHGELEQRERDQVLVRFANRSCSVLVATDIAARGLDIAQLEAVINVDITPDPRCTPTASAAPAAGDAGAGPEPGQHGRDGPRGQDRARPRRAANRAGTRWPN
jgi:ATP-independent RNA helicase DbpA